ncbi:NAD(P)H-binding protein [Schumannella sp. 10F1B-5-1]|uniref:NAD(P)H-binding protein n=1 Tax=Schumannella sp. 10F1B-5-1 TaxID=2590780 RepID=UPI001131FB9C|nr:NAD(P)H-binding protein [Schumannella sp. 10F1B-5-1]TPW73455.1 NAD-dependent epimerase/dehydratase family protein [Schumannella sp. 10F1B-5-1]
MDIVIAGGHGKIALLLSSLLSADGHRVRGLVRNPDHADDLAAAGAEAVVLDLEQADDAAVAEAISGADAVVFAAGAGANSGAARKLTLDRDGAILLADAAVQAGVTRYLLVSAIGADRFDPDSDDVFQVYLRAKSEADAAVRERDELDWTILRPGGLLDEPGTGAIAVADEVPRGDIPRADVAAVLAELLRTGGGVHRQVELTSGPTPIAEAVAGL